MTEKDAPRVKLPDMMPRKPVVPGPNSWAQSKQQQQQSTVSNDLGGVRVTHRDKYENKPMPRPPAETTQNAYLQAKTYIQPAIPLVNPVSSMQTYKNRAVTDPIAPKPLFAGRKLSVTQLRKRYSGPKTKDDEIPKEEAKATNESFPIVGLNSEKAAQVLGLIPAIEDKRNMALASAPTAAVPDVYRESSDNPMGRTGSPVRQVQSTPVPTRRYLRENDLPTPKSVEVDKDTKQQSNEDLKVEEHGPTGLGDRTLLSGMLQPPRVGTHGNVGGVNLVEGIGMHRVESFRGVIENASTPGGNEKEMSSGSIRDLSQPGTAGTQHFVELRSPAVYSPSNYGGVWENDPAVGFSLPPFSPLPKGFQQNLVTNGRTSPEGTGLEPPTFRNQYGNVSYTNANADPSFNTESNPNPNTNRGSQFQHPFPSANSWASGSRGDSYESSNHPLSALLPPRWPHHINSNSVPSPPHTQHDYQRPGSLSATLAQLELTLHHHIDNSFGSMSRLITDKHDRMMDQTIRRSENLEDMMNKGFRCIRADIKDVRKDFGNLKKETKEIVKSSNGTGELIRQLEGKLEAIDKSVEKYGREIQHSISIAEQSTSEPESDRQQRAKSRRRTESAHGALGSGDHHHQYRSGASRSSNSVRHSGNSGRAHRPNTPSGQIGSRMSDERSTRREYFTELGAAIGPMPDLRDHPAFAASQPVQLPQDYGHGQPGMPVALNGGTYENQSLGDGRWYQQAYGHNH